MYVYIYIYTYSSLAKSLKTINFFNAVCTLLCCFGIQTKKTHTKKKQHYVSTNHRPPLACFVFCLVFFFCFVFFWFGFQSRRAKWDHIEKMIVCFSIFLKFLPNISKINWKKSKQTNEGPWKVSPCLLSHTSGYHPSVHVFLIFSWFGHPPSPESYLKRWEKIQHSHDLKI